jgi:hypothetical protein
VANKSETINELAKALSLAQGELHGALADANNPFFNSTYADLASIWESIRKPLTKNGLSVTQCLGENEHGLTLETLLLHSSGQWISSTIPIKSKMDHPKQWALALLIPAGTLWLLLSVFTR